MKDTPFDLDFLLKAANYGPDPNAPHSAEARRAVDIVAERFRLAAELDLKVIREKLKSADPALLASES